MLHMTDRQLWMWMLGRGRKAQLSSKLKPGILPSPVACSKCAQLPDRLFASQSTSVQLCSLAEMAEARTHSRVCPRIAQAEGHR